MLPLAALLWCRGSISAVPQYRVRAVASSEEKATRAAPHRPQAGCRRPR